MAAAESAIAIIFFFIIAILNTCLFIALRHNVHTFSALEMGCRETLIFGYHRKDKEINNMRFPLHHSGPHHVSGLNPESRRDVN